MDRKQYKNTLLIGSVCLVVFFVGIRWITGSIENQLANRVEKMKEELRNEQEPLTSLEQEPRVLTPTDLTPYQIIPDRKSRLFKNQQYWDVRTKDAVEQSDAMSRLQQEGKFNGIKKTPEEFKEQIRLIDGRIKAYKKKIRMNAADDYARQKLQELYSLKATLRVLRDRLVLENQ